MAFIDFEISDVLVECHPDDIADHIAKKCGEDMARGVVNASKEGDFFTTAAVLGTYVEIPVHAEHFLVDAYKNSAKIIWGFAYNRLLEADVEGCLTLAYYGSYLANRAIVLEVNSVRNN